MLAASVAFFVVAFGVGVFACRKLPSTLTTTTEASSNASPSPGALTDSRFCGQGLTPIPGGGCFSAPEGTGEFPLVIYLHGLHDDTSLSEELARQSRVAELGAHHHGKFAVLAFHGKKGDCTLRRLDNLYCWPSNDHTAGEAPAIVASFAGAISEAGKRGARGPRYLLGFSNGGYFAMLIAERSLTKLDAVVVAHGGPMPPTERPSHTPPLLLLTADDDAAIDDMLRLSRELSLVRWTHTILSREGTHGLPPSDVIAALDFFETTAQHKPFQPPPSSHPPRPSARLIVEADAVAPPGPMVTPLAPLASAAAADGVSVDPTSAAQPENGASASPELAP